MPQVIKVGSYVIFFWLDEGMPLEPVHVHVAEGRAVPDATKIWITSTGKTLLCNNRSDIPERILRRIMKVIEANSVTIINDWLIHFGEIRYYC